MRPCHRRRDTRGVSELRRIARRIAWKIAPSCAELRRARLQRGGEAEVVRRLRALHRRRRQVEVVALVVVAVAARAERPLLAVAGEHADEGGGAARDDARRQLAARDGARLVGVAHELVEQLDAADAVEDGVVREQVDALARHPHADRHRLRPQRLRLLRELRRVVEPAVARPQQRVEDVGVGGRRVREERRRHDADAQVGLRRRRHRRRLGLDRAQVDRLREVEPEAVVRGGALLDVAAVLAVEDVGGGHDVSVSGWRLGRRGVVAQSNSGRG